MPETNLQPMLVRILAKGIHLAKWRAVFFAMWSEQLDDFSGFSVMIDEADERV